ncbi:carbohydrate-binding protein [Agrobacterium vitis]|uniref:carbohydrate-binding protein n=1 Tax=Agrobacterium vitis TaxID=373 RepID=UPI0008DC20F3|nr:carbohydrate-binding protein [Agrobacterium vitis]MUO89032.1 carbohydrate-binding protein [Agrobacterium vitis]MUZ53471.1 carbohydrate-binding protein [Agrobacterium vitis]MUZ93526.1 carbohydrate-binding protein [Agrobacterium vitis]MVA42295.1 carbohydrate-binding protein [Agrobacterium vitis]NSX99213.1 carbohydrate-binding protein [Agrobacterium vitis]
MRVTLTVVDAAGQNLAQSSADHETFLVYRQPYRDGDRLLVDVSEPGHVRLALDAAIAPAILYLPQGRFSFSIPFGARKIAYQPHAFCGDLHRLYAAKARSEEIVAQRNLAFNPLDDHANSQAFPHVEANVETRGEAAFAVRNVIDGERANSNHGFWPFTSWGINRDPQAALTLFFGRPVTLSEVVLTLRADFPHDAWWESAVLSFSGGEETRLALVKSSAAQRFSLPETRTEWVRLHSLVKADDPSPFPALTQIEVWGTEA